MKFYFGFISGVLVSIFFIAGTLWGFHWSLTGDLKSNTSLMDSKIYGGSEYVRKSAEQFLRIGYFTQLVGATQLSTLAMTKAAVRFAQLGDEAAVEKASAYFKTALTMGRDYSLKSLDYKPLIQAYLAYGTFFKKMGQKNEATDLLNRALENSLEHTQDNYLMNTIENELSSLTNI